MFLNINDRWFNHTIAARREHAVVQTQRVASLSAARKCIQRWNNRLLSRCWEGLVHHTHTQLLCRRVLNRIAHGALGRAWNAFTRATQQREREQHIARKIFRRWIRIRLIVSFRTWQTRVKLWAQQEEARALVMDRVLRRIQKVSYGRMWGIWKARTHAMGAGRARMLTVTRRIYTSKMSEAWRVWREHSQAACAAEVEATRVQKQNLALYFRIQSTFEKKQLERGQKNALRRCLRRSTHRTLSQTLHQMHAYVRLSADAQRKEKLGRHFFLTLRNRAISSALRAWIARVVKLKQERQLKRRVIARITNAQAAMCFDHWHALIIAKKAKRKRAVRVLAHISHSKSAKTWSSWVGYVGKIKVQRAMVRRVFARIARGALLTNFTAWSAMTTRRKKARRMIAHIGERVRVKGWNSWVSYLKILKRKRAMLQRAVAHMTMGTIAPCFTSWVRLVGMTKDLKGITARVFTRWHSRRLSAAFRAWQAGAWTAASRATRAKSEAAMLRAVKKALALQREALLSEHASQLEIDRASLHATYQTQLGALRLDLNESLHTISRLRDALRVASESEKERFGRALMEALATQRTTLDAVKQSEIEIEAARVAREYEGELRALHTLIEDLRANAAVVVRSEAGG